MDGARVKVFFYLKMFRIFFTNLPFRFIWIKREKEEKMKIIMFVL